MFNVPCPVILTSITGIIKDRYYVLPEPSYLLIDFRCPEGFDKLLVFTEEA